MLSCPYCDYKNRSKAFISRHINLVHPDKKDELRTCKYCNKKFKTVATCEKHVANEVCKKLEEVFGHKESSMEKVTDILTSSSPQIPISHEIEPILNLELTHEQVQEPTQVEQVTKKSPTSKWVWAFTSMLAVTVLFKILGKRI